jgi:hypothetical protein
MDKAEVGGREMELRTVGMPQQIPEKAPVVVTAAILQTALEVAMADQEL